MAEARRADSDTQFDVDLMILDYLLYMATQALLEERKAEKEGSALPDGAKPDLPIQMVDCRFSRHSMRSCSSTN